MTPHPIPDEALNSHIGILGKVGSGKTYTAKGLVERLLHLRRHVVIIDPTGAWYGLRTGFEIPIFGGRHGDVEISDKAGEAVAAVIVDQRTSAIIDLSLMTGGGQQRFMRTFAHRLRQKPLGALYLVIDEADEFLPQNVPSDQTNAYGDLRWMVRRGRLSGFRVMMITQRPAEIAKAVLTQIETLVAHRLTAPQDRKAIEEWVKGHHDPAEAREVLNSLASLDKGTAWVWAPDLGILKREAMPPIETFDSSRTPEPGEAEVAPPRLEALDLSAIREALAEAEEPTKPAKNIPGNIPSWPDQRKEVETLKAANAAFEGAMQRATQAVRQADAAVQDAYRALTEIPITIPAKSGGDPAPLPRRERATPPKAASKPEGGVAPNTCLNAAAEIIAGLLKGLPGQEAAWPSLLIMGGFRPGSGWIRKSQNQLVEQGYITCAYEVTRATERLLSSGILALTQPVPAELRSLWRAKLRGPGGAIATWLAENGPSTRQQVADGVGMSSTAGWFRKGVKDVLGSNLAREDDGKLIPHPLLVDDSRKAPR